MVKISDICLSLNINPNNFDLELEFISSSKVFIVAKKHEQINSFLENIQLHKKRQAQYKQIFIEQWLYKFDGNCKNRLLKALSS